ncbi:MAG: acylphosphatase, partial [Acetobacteraceae bacterium]|nr:acylphosphatase [Acetobacteraceae bacterium]
MPKTEHAELIRVRGLVQGVGFRPTVWRLADRHGLRGWVGNDGGGVTLSVCGRPA